MKIIPFYLLITIFLISATPSFTQTPEQVVSNYFNKLQNGGINTIASLMHPDELKNFRERLTPIIESNLALYPAKFQKFADPLDSKKMRTFDDAGFLNAFIEWVDAMNPIISAAIKSAKIEPIGHIVEGDLKHVVIRMKVANENGEIEKLSVVSTKDFQGNSKMILTAEMKGIAESLKKIKPVPVTPKRIE